ncbi:MAG: DedA family protein [Deltaproteobacteria bacterium]|nr:DedA family protein [Deltaproteobacteria bacterium]
MTGMDVNGNEILSLFSIYSYWIVFFGVMLDNAGLPIPGELFLLLAGALTGIGKMDFTTSVLVAVTGAVIGDSFAYYIGRWGGKRLINLYLNCSLCTCDCTNKLESLFKKFGNISIPLARFVMGVRVVSSPVAGALRMAYLKFLLLDLLGAAIWSLVYLAAGFILKSGILDLLPVIEKIRHRVFLVFFLLIFVYMIFKLYRRARLGKPDLRSIIHGLRASKKRDMDRL